MSDLDSSGGAIGLSSDLSIEESVSVLLACLFTACLSIAKASLIVSAQTMGHGSDCAVNRRLSTFLCH